MSGACQAGGILKSCGTHGICTSPTASSSMCICDFGYVQDLRTPREACQPYDACGEIHNLCANGGTCTTEAPPKLFSCECPKYYSGNRCEIFDSPCESQPCQNDGECVYLAASDPPFMCICGIGYSGDLCETKNEYGIGGVGHPVTGAILVLLWVIVAVALLAMVYCLVMAILECLALRVKKTIENARKAIVGGGGEEEAPAN